VYVDSGVLILASKAQEDEVSQQAIEELDREAAFLFSSIVELETLPQPTIHGFEAQVEFLKIFFNGAERVRCTEDVQNIALTQACTGVGLNAADALHVACAIQGEATELLTSEKPTNTLPQATGITVRTIFV